MIEVHIKKIFDLLDADEDETADAYIRETLETPYFTNMENRQALERKLVEGLLKLETAPLAFSLSMRKLFDWDEINYKSAELHPNLPAFLKELEQRNVAYRKVTGADQKHIWKIALGVVVLIAGSINLYFKFSDSPTETYDSSSPSAFQADLEHYKPNKQANSKDIKTYVVIAQDDVIACISLELAHKRKSSKAPVMQTGCRVIPVFGWGLSDSPLEDEFKKVRLRVPQNHGDVIFYIPKAKLLMRKWDGQNK